MLLSDITTTSSNATFVITLSSNGTADLDLYCSPYNASSTSLLSSAPTPSDHRFASAWPGGGDEQVVVRSDNLYAPLEEEVTETDSDGTVTGSYTQRTMECLVVSAETTGSGATYTLTVDFREGDDAIDSTQETVLSAIMAYCCGDDGSGCPTYKAALDEAGLTIGQEGSGDLCAFGSMGRCSADGFVQAVNISSQGLSCSVTTSFFSYLTSLEDMDISGNNFTGAGAAAVLLALATAGAPVARVDLSDAPWDEASIIAASCQALSTGSLTVLLAANASVAGGLPSCLLQDGSSLEVLDLSANALSGAFPSVAAPTALWSLDVSSNQLSGNVPSTLLDASDQLRSVDLSSNVLAGSLPPVPASSILTFNASHNAFSGSVPDSVAAHATLTTYDVSDNDLVALPTAWTADQSADSGSANATASAAAALALLNASRNAIADGFPAGLAAYPSLATLDVSHNAIQGSIPDASNGFSQLQIFYAGDNALTGTLPSALGSSGLFTLQPTSSDGVNVLSLPNNLLTGALPSYLESASLPSYLEVDLRNNSFSDACLEVYNNVGEACSVDETSPAVASPAVAPTASPEAEAVASPSTSTSASPSTSPEVSASPEESSPDLSASPDLSPSPSPSPASDEGTSTNEAGSSEASPAPADKSSSSSLSGGKIAVAVIFSVVAVFIIGLSAFFIRRVVRRRREAASAASAGPSGGQPKGPVGTAAAAVKAKLPAALGGERNFERFNDQQSTEMVGAPWGGAQGAWSGAAAAAPAAPAPAPAPGATGGWGAQGAAAGAAAGAGGWGTTAAQGAWSSAAASGGPSAMLAAGGWGAGAAPAPDAAASPSTVGAWPSTQPAAGAPHGNPAAQGDGSDRWQRGGYEW